MRNIYLWFIRGILSFAFLCIHQAALSQKLPAGVWVGDLYLGGSKPYKIILSFVSPSDNAHTILLAVPALGIHDLRAESIKSVQDSLQLSFRDHMSQYSFAFRYYGSEAKLAGGFALKGSEEQIPLQLEQSKGEGLQPVRPQTPRAPFPYDVLPVEFAGGDDGITLRGTITAPRGRKRVPGVVLVSGSGPHNRDGEQFSHETFLVLADELTKRGFAVLRYDERGVGESSGHYGGHFTEDFARDGAAAVKALRADKRVKVKEVFVVGHSEGTLMTQIIAAEDPSIAGIVLLAAAGLPGVEFNKTQYRGALRARGISEEKAGQDLMIQDKSYEIVGASPDSATAVANLRKWHQEIGMDPRYSVMYIAPFVDPWRFHSLHFNPKPYLRRIKAPVLAVTGDNDSQTPAEPNLKGIRNGLLEGGNNNFTEVVLSKVNHYMQTSITGAYDEPYLLEETFSPEGLKIVGDWLELQTKKAGKRIKGK